MKRLFALVLAALLSLPASSALAADLLVAQAANFMPAMQEIIPAFKAKTGLDVQATYTSTGKLYGQITHGAPFDVFLAADQRRPDLLFAAGKAEKPFVYAKGQIVFWSKSADFSATTWQKAVTDPKLSKIAIANIETAPYGTSAMNALKDSGLWDALAPRLVYAQTIAQVFQYAETGAADAGFCAYSSMFSDQGRAGSYVVVDSAPSVVQAACILKNAQHKDAAQRFVEFLASPEVQAIKSRYGYK